MDIAITIEAAGSAVTLLTVVGAIARWSGKVDRNTEATKELTRVLQGTTTQVHSNELRLENHEVRISTLEKKIEQG